MLQSDTINKVMFDYGSLTKDELSTIISQLPLKMMRWLGANHPDNKTRKLIFRLSNITIGAGSVINSNFVVSDDYHKLLIIGERVAISPNVTVICCSAPNNSSLNTNPYVMEHLIVDKEVRIENDVWVGANVVILPGVTIGQNSVIGAGSIVTKSVEPHSVYAGNPAKKIRDIKQ